jgi:hypothetical protein
MKYQKVGVEKSKIGYIQLEILAIVETDHACFLEVETDHSCSCFLQ